MNKKFKSSIEQTMDYIIKSNKFILDSIIEKKKLNYFNIDESHRKKLTEIRNQAFENMMNIQRVEIISMRNPPRAVQLTFKALAHISAKKLKDLWKGKNAGLFHKIIFEDSALIDRLLSLYIDKITEIHTRSQIRSIFKWVINGQNYGKMISSSKEPKEYYDLLNEEKKFKAIINFFLKKITVINQLCSFYQ